MASLISMSGTDLHSPDRPIDSSPKHPQIGPTLRPPPRAAAYSSITTPSPSNPTHAASDGP